MMKTISLKLFTMLALLLALVVTLVLGCRGGGAASMPIEVKLAFSEPPILGKPVKITATFNLVKNYFREVVPGVDAKITLPEGFQLVDGTTEWKGDFVIGQVYTIEATVKTVQTGTWQVIASAVYFKGGEGISGSKALYVTVTENSATISDRPPPGTIVPPLGQLVRLRAIRYPAHLYLACHYLTRKISLLH